MQKDQDALPFTLMIFFFSDNDFPLVQNHFHTSFVLYLQWYRDAFEAFGRHLPAAFRAGKIQLLAHKKKKNLQVFQTSLHAMSKGQSSKPLFLYKII